MNINKNDFYTLAQHDKLTKGFPSEALVLYWYEIASYVCKDQKAIHREDQIQDIVLAMHRSFMTLESIKENYFSYCISIARTHLFKYLNKNRRQGITHIPKDKVASIKTVSDTIIPYIEADQEVTLL